MLPVFTKRVLIVGFGSVGRCTLPVLLKHIDIPHHNITVLDCADKRSELAPWIEKGVRYAQDKITPVNLAKTLSRHVSTGGMVIDLSWNIDCIDILTWCHDNRVLYVNTSVEEWDPYAAIHTRSPYEKSLYYKQMAIRAMAAKWNHGSVTAVLDHGANPGLISHFTKRGLIDIGRKVCRDRTTKKQHALTLRRLLAEKDFARLAMALGVRTIHCSERDTQMTDRPKEANEFVGTWSIEGLREEGTAPAELGWGTHETKPPVFWNKPSRGPKNQVFFSQMGMNTWVRSWVPYGEIIGMVVRHAEAFSISEALTVRERGKAVYRPTVHYAYSPCNETLASLHELRANNYELQPKQRIMSDEIIKGEDALGALIMGHPYSSWWTGSVLSIEDSRALVPHQNATTVQVAIGVVSAIVWLLDHQDHGICLPEDLPHDQILQTARPYLGRFVSEASDWTPFKNYQMFFAENPASRLDPGNPWSFNNFLFRD